MTPTILTSLGLDAQGRAGRGADLAKGGDQTFGALLADLAEGATPQIPSAQTAPPSPTIATEAAGKPADRADIGPGIATVSRPLNAANDAGAAPAGSGSASNGKEWVQSLLAKLASGSRAADPDNSGRGGALASAQHTRGPTGPDPTQHPESAAPLPSETAAPMADAAAATPVAQAVPAASPAISPPVSSSDRSDMTSTFVSRAPIQPTRVPVPPAKTLHATTTSPSAIFDALPTQAPSLTARGPAVAQPTGGTDPMPADAVAATSDNAVAASLSSSMAAVLLPFAAGIVPAAAAVTNAAVQFGEGGVAAAEPMAAGATTRSFARGREVRPSPSLAAASAVEATGLVAAAASRGDIAPADALKAVKVTLVGATAHPAPMQPLPASEGIDHFPTSIAGPVDTAAPASDGGVAAPAGGTETARASEGAAPVIDRVRTAIPASREAAAVETAVRAIADAVTTLASSAPDASPAAPLQADDVAPRPSFVPQPARSLTLQLSPADLGDVTVHLRLRDGALDVRVSVDDRKTLGLITHARDALASAIGDAATPLNSLVIQGSDTASPQTVGSHDLARSNHGAAGAGAGADSGSGRASGRGTGGETRRQPNMPPRDPRARDARAPDGLFV